MMDKKEHYSYKKLMKWLVRALTDLAIGIILLFFSRKM